jgi:Protein of unknown function (DUF2934)
MRSAAAAGPAIETTEAESPEILERNDAQEIVNGDHFSEPTSMPMDTHAEISKLAYTLWCQRGCPEGSPEVDWFRAEQKFREI